MEWILVVGGYHALLSHALFRNNFDPAILWSQVAWYLALTVWHAMPTVPAKSKWIKFGPCATFHFLGQATGGALAACIDIGLWSIFKIEVVDPMRLEVYDMTWHKLGGSRLTKTLGFLGGPLLYCKLACLAIASEPVRWLTL